MGLPEFDDVLDETIETSDQESSNLIVRLAKAMTKAAYWQGRCEGQELTIAYLKDRLNRSEAPRHAEEVT